MQVKKNVIFPGHATGQLHARRLNVLEGKINDILNRTQDRVSDTLGLPIDKYSAAKFSEIARDKYAIMDEKKRKSFDKLINDFYDGTVKKIEVLDGLVKDKPVLKARSSVVARTGKRKTRQLKVSVANNQLKSRNKAVAFRRSTRNLGKIKMPGIVFHAEKCFAEK